MTAVPTTDRKHAILSASSSHRWMACTPSARLEETLPESTSEYAEEGRLAHEIAELKLRKMFIEPMSTRAFNSKLRKLQQEPLYQDEMLSYTDDYIDYIKGIALAFPAAPYVAAEKRLDFSGYVPEGFGTGDCIIIGGDTMYIIDFKYGKGVPVSADKNPQMMLYALGALADYSFLYDIKNIKTTIYQPRIDAVSEYTISVDDLIAWGDEIKPIAQTAWEGKGEFVAGDHCRFCRAKAQCRARSDTMSALEVFGQQKPELLSDAEIAEILNIAGNYKKWVEDVEEYALSAVLDGKEIPGWKAVEGRSNRAFTNVDEAFAVIKKSGVDESVLYERKPITLTATEKLLGKKEFAEMLGGYIIKPPGKPTLVKESDSREPFSGGIKAADVFSD